MTHLFEFFILLRVLTILAKRPDWYSSCWKHWTRTRLLLVATVRCLLDIPIILLGPKLCLLSVFLTGILRNGKENPFLDVPSRNDSWSFLFVEHCTSLSGLHGYISTAL
ncbi:uncharacterized protein LOC143242614 isoform X1 [Tachypleus tridentatus]|uniref:uncharacterized protein LOC143242614 isoform X1 n=1 Tax=Tachypleus tridentatus TaxID=6853 RepID=UPI003FD238D0